MPNMNRPFLPESVSHRVSDTGVSNSRYTL
jgi:hypothetical protein